LLLPRPTHCCCPNTIRPVIMHILGV
jgi:hypothetical protein